MRDWEDYKTAFVSGGFGKRLKMYHLVNVGQSCVVSLG